MKCSDVLNVLRGLAPEEIAVKDDPVGLLIGLDSDRDVDKIGVCLDATPDVARRAAEIGVQILIAHHPLIYLPLRQINPGTDPISQSVTTLIKSDIALYAMHTNWDRAEGGVNDTLADLLELQDILPLGPDGLTALPRIGSLAAPMTLEEFRGFVSETLSCDGTSALRVSPVSQDRTISRVAVCGGAGASLMVDAIAAGADVYVTSDVRHHEFVDAAGRDFALIDAGHFATESPGMGKLAEILAGMLPGVETYWLDG
jgi:dinuclear metal center YbgI/SA1388 family protein